MSVKLASDELAQKAASLAATGRFTYAQAQAHVLALNADLATRWLKEINYDLPKVQTSEIESLRRERDQLQGLVDECDAARLKLMRENAALREGVEEIERVCSLERINVHERLLSIGTKARTLLTGAKDG